MHHVIRSLVVFSLVLPAFARGGEPEKPCPKKNCPQAQAAAGEACQKACAKKCDATKTELTAAAETACAKSKGECKKGECTKTAAAESACAKKRGISLVMWIAGGAKTEAKACPANACETKTACTKSTSEKSACAKSTGEGKKALTIEEWMSLKPECVAKSACATAKNCETQACPVTGVKQVVATSECPVSETRVAPATAFLDEGCPLAKAKACSTAVKSDCDKSAVANCAKSCDKAACAVASQDECGCPEQKLEHLMAAATHLQAAGLKCQATKVLEVARDVRRDVLRRKLDQLAELRTQVERLQEDALFEPAATASVPSDLPK